MRQVKLGGLDQLRGEEEEEGGPPECTEGLRRRAPSRIWGSNTKGQDAFDLCSDGT